MKPTPKLALATTKNDIYAWVCAWALAAVVLLMALWALTAAQQLGKTAIFWDQKVYALLFVVAGFGLGLQERRPGMEKLRVKKGLQKSGLYIFGIGAFLSFIWMDQPIAALGLSMVASSFFYRKKYVVLWLSAISIAVFFLGLCLLFDFETFRAGDNFMRSYSQLWHPWHLFRYLIFDGFFPLIPWFSFWLIGQWLGRKPMHKSKFRLKVLLLSIFVYVSAGIGSLVLESFPHELIGIGLENMELLYFSNINRLIPMPLFMLRAAAASLVILLTLWSFGEMVFGISWLRPVQVLGEMWLSALTILVTVFGLLRLSGLRLNFEKAFYAGLVLLLICGLGAWFWKKNHKRGPLEEFLANLPK